MKAAVYNHYGPTSVLETQEIPKPDFSKGVATVRIHAISLNPRDLVIRRGEFKILTGRKFPKLTGVDFSGVIERVNAPDTDFAIGDEVFGYYASLSGGVSAEYVNIPVQYIAPKPAELSHQQACTLGCAYLTALQALRDKARVNVGDEVMIYGASGGVGTAGIQLGKYLGATVTAVSNSRNEEYCYEQGADHFVAYDQQNAFEMDKKFDVFFQVYAGKGDLYGQAEKVLHQDGIFVCLIPNPLLVFKKLFYRPKFEFFLVKSSRADLEQLADLAQKGIIAPQISKTYALNDMQAAQQALEDESGTGKIVVEVNSL